MCNQQGDTISFDLRTMSDDDVENELTETGQLQQKLVRRLSHQLKECEDGHWKT